MACLSETQLDGIGSIWTSFGGWLGGRGHLHSTRTMDGPLLRKLTRVIRTEAIWWRRHSGSCCCHPAAAPGGAGKPARLGSKYACKMRWH